MATVYAAEQLFLKRRLALKVLPFVTVFEPRQLQRFKNEARAAAALRLLHIVQLFAFGCERGMQYYAMEYIEGQTVAQAVADLAQPKNSQEPTAVAENPTQRSQLASRDKGDSTGEGNTDAPSFQ